MRGPRIAETDRLILREAVEDDAEAFLAFNSDPRVMRYTGEPPWADLAEVRRRLRDYPDYRRHGFGRWAVVYKPDGRVVGFNGLKYLPELDEVDLGFRFAFDYWGRGLATESSMAALSHGFADLGLGRIIALVLPENSASIRVLEKVGMTFRSRVTYLGQGVQRWAVERDEWVYRNESPPSS